MQLTAIFTSLLALAVFTTAFPLTQPSTVLVTFQTRQDSPGGPPVETHQVFVQIDKLAVLGVIRAARIYVTTASPDLDINRIECQAYKDANGLVLGSAPFTIQKPALLTTQTSVDVGSVKCYLV